MLISDNIARLIEKMLDDGGGSPSLNETILHRSSAAFRVRLIM